MKLSTRIFVTIAWFVGPWSRYSIGPGGRLSDAFLALAYVSIWVFTNPHRDREPGVFFLPKECRRHLIGLLLIAGGISAGSTWTNLSLAPVIEVVLNAGLAAAPVILLLRIRADERLRSTLATAFVLGVTVSVLTAPVFGFAAQRGRWQGITGHMNQLGMTIAIALPMLSLVLPKHRFRSILVPVIAAILLVGLERSGSRSGALAAAFSLLWMAISWRIRNPGSMLRPKVALAVLAAVVGTALALPSLTVAPDEESDTLRSRIFSGGTASASDEKREELLSRGVESVFTPGALIGAGYSSEERSPHNALLELYLAGGLVAVAGGIVVFAPAIAAVLSAVLGVDRRRPVRPSARFATGAIAWVIAISLNNLFWARFGWLTLALWVTARADERRAAQHAAAAGDDGADGHGEATVPAVGRAVAQRGPTGTARWSSAR